MLLPLLRRRPGAGGERGSTATSVKTHPSAWAWFACIGFSGSATRDILEEAQNLNEKFLGIR
jgi:hypothetical protein